MKTTSSSRAGAGRKAIRTVAALAAALCAGAAAPAPAEAIRCGDTIPPGSTVVLSADLTCDDVDVALTVVGPAVLDLGTRTVICSDANQNGREVIQGVVLVGAGAVLRNGVVRDCRLAIGVEGEGRHQVSDVTAVFSASDGIRILSDRNRVVSSSAVSNGGAGFAVAGKANLIAENESTDNRFGYDVEQRNTLERNVATASEKIGFLVRSRNATLRDNGAVANPIGFEITGKSNRLDGNDAAGNSTGFFLDDRARRNLLIANTAEDSLISGFVVRGIGNRLLQSRAERNGAHGIRVGSGAQRSIVRASVARDNDDADLSDGTARCGTNRWRNNDFGTADQACIE